MATVSRGGTTARFRFTHRYRQDLGVAYLCEWLKVSRSGYYAWRDRPRSARANEDAMLLTRIRDIHQKNRGVYGSPRVYKALKNEGVAVGKKRVERLMREHDLKGRVARVTRRQPGLKRFIARGENLKLNKSDATDVNQVWVSDITFIKVKDVYKHLIVIMDIYSRKILGWSLSHTRTSEDTVTVLKRVVRKRSPSEGMIFHIDRGIEFTGQQFRKELQKHGIRQC